MFLSKNKKNIATFWLKKAPYQELCLYFAHAQDDLNLHILYMVKDSFSLDMAHLIWSYVCYPSLYIFTGNVYLVGTTNSGKSTLFNTFLRSDYCKSACRDIVQRATVSQWPGMLFSSLCFQKVF